MMKKGLLFLLIILLVSCQTSEIQKVDVNNMSDEYILLLMESKGYDISSPTFSCIYNNRIVYGPNYTEPTEPTLTVTPVNESVEITELTEEPNTEEPIEESLGAEEATKEEAGKTLPQEVVLNTPIEYNIPENAFISEGEEELDILAQWDAFIEEETLSEEATTEETEPITEEPEATRGAELSTELTEITQIEITEEPKAEKLTVEETPVAALFRAEKPVLPEFKQILVQDAPQEAVFEPILEKPTAQLAAENLIEGGLIVILVFIVTLALGAGVFLLRRHCAKENNEQTEKY